MIQKTAVCSVSRVQSQIKREPFLKKSLTSAEIRYCFAKKYPAESAAARIAAKKAVLCLLKVSAVKQSLWMRDIQILKKADGKPFLRFSPRFRKKFEMVAKAHWMLSLAHEKKLAIAWVAAC